MCSEDVHIEFYAPQEPESISVASLSMRTSGPVHVHWVVMRFANLKESLRLGLRHGQVSAAIQQSGESSQPTVLQELDRYLASLQNLRGVVFETKGTTSESDPLVKGLTSIEASKLYRRTCEQAHKLALDIKKARTRCDPPYLVSPYWYLNRWAEYAVEEERWEDW